MKKLLLLLLLIPFAAGAVQNASYPTRTQFAVTNLGSTWLVLVGTTAKAVKGFYLSSSAADSLGVLHDVELGIASSTAPGGTEVPQVIIPANSAGIFIPFTTQGQVRISVEGIDGVPLTEGEIVLNTLFY